MKRQEETLTLPCGGSPAPTARGTRKMRTAWRVRLGAAVLSLGAIAGCADAPRQGATAATVDTVDLSGLERSLAAQRGHAVLVNFWAMW